MHCRRQIFIVEDFCVLIGYNNRKGKIATKLKISIFKMSPSKRMTEIHNTLIEMNIQPFTSYSTIILDNRNAGISFKDMWSDKPTPKDNKELLEIIKEEHAQHIPLKLIEDEETMKKARKVLLKFARRKASKQKMSIVTRLPISSFHRILGNNFNNNDISIAKITGINKKEFLYFVKQKGVPVAPNNHLCNEKGRSDSIKETTLSKSYGMYDFTLRIHPIESPTEFMEFNFSQSYYYGVLFFKGGNSDEVYNLRNNFNVNCFLSDRYASMTKQIEMHMLNVLAKYFANTDLADSVVNAFTHKLSNCQWL